MTHFQAQQHQFLSFIASDRSEQLIYLTITIALSFHEDLPLCSDNIARRNEQFGCCSHEAKELPIQWRMQSSILEDQMRLSLVLAEEETGHDVGLCDQAG